MSIFEQLTPRRLAVYALALGVALSGAVLAAGCLDGPDAEQEFLCPDHDVFVQYVSPLLERRCGTLDCHGNSLRPMSFYGELGLRHPLENNVAGGAATTQREADANYRSLCSVEPEKISAVAQDPGGQSVNKLLLVRKARGTEGHKGGKVFEPFDDADLCVVGWLRGDNVRSIAPACQAALDRLP
jgi:hypothetical protein